MKILKTASLGSNFNKKKSVYISSLQEKVMKIEASDDKFSNFTRRERKWWNYSHDVADKSSALVLLDREEQLRNNLAILRFMATSKTWIRTLDLYPAPRPWKTWIQKNRDPEKIGPWNADVKIAGCEKTIRRPHCMILWKLEIC